MIALTRTSEDGIARDINDPEHALLKETAPSFVASANLQLGESLLDLGCGLASVAIEARQVLGPYRGAIIAIEASHKQLE